MAQGRPSFDSRFDVLHLTFSDSDSKSYDSSLREPSLLRTMGSEVCEEAGSDAKLRHKGESTQ